MPQAINSPSWSSPHSSRSTRPPLPKHKLNRIPVFQPTTVHAAGSMSRDSFANLPPLAPRASSMAGKKRTREGEAVENKRITSRRTKSVGENARGDVREREAFQRQLIGVFVPRALKESAEGSVANYNDLLAHFLPTPTQPIVALQPLLPLLRALTAHVSLLKPELHHALVSAIVALPWATGDDRFVKSYVGFAGVLVSAHPSWAKEIVAMAVRGLTWQPCLSPSSASPITRRAYHARNHLLLSHLLSLIPTLPNVLQPLLNRYSPHKREPEVAQTTWVRNCCELIEYCPELGARVWSGLVDRMLRIDVEITNSVEEDDDTDDEDDDEDLTGAGNQSPVDPFDLLINQDVTKPAHDDDSDSDSDDDAEPDIDALSSDDERDSDSDADEAAQLVARVKRRDNLRSMRHKLDGMLCHFLGHLEECMGDKERGVSAAEIAALSLASRGSSGSSTPASASRPGTPTATTPVTPGIVTPYRPAPTPAQSLAHFQTLLHLFSQQILPTSATQHLPFVLFACASFSPAHTDLFLHLLVSQSLFAIPATASAGVASAGHQPVALTQRVAATVYIGSLVCRARFVTDDQARTVMTYLLAYVDGKLAQARACPTLATLDELPLFYAVCQAAMLIFCFRWRAFTTAANPQAPTDDSVLGELDMDGESDAGAPQDAGEDGRWLRDLDILQRALTSELNPLLGCNPTIVSTFAKVAHATGFAYCFSIIEANAHAHAAAARSTSSTSLTNRSASASRTPSRAASGAGAPRAFQRTISAPAAPPPPTLAAPRTARQTNVEAGLDAYFPFDPYDLPRSGERVESLYRTWDEVAVDLGGDDSDSDTDDEVTEGAESDSDDDELDARGRLSTSASVGRSVPKLPKAGSFGQHRRNILRDGGLSTSLEGMSISPNIGVFSKS